PVVFIDTAGLREARDEIEVEGIRRSQESLQKAEILLHVVDVSEPQMRSNETCEFPGKKQILVLNKIDLIPDAEMAPKFGDRAKEQGVSSAVSVTCKTGQGIEALKDAIKNVVWSGQIKAEMLEVMINSRHQDALERSRAATVRSIEALRNRQTLELAAMDLRI